MSVCLCVILSGSIIYYYIHALSVLKLDHRYLVHLCCITSVICNVLTNHTPIQASALCNLHFFYLHQLLARWGNSLYLTEHNCRESPIKRILCYMLVMPFSRSLYRNEPHPVLTRPFGP